ncbi:MAG: hypothetical protein M0042_01420 [Nitrospiraceae bacterium]|nr:hypothetical protein [Nitrospiraceae bacterium]
MKVNCWEFKQCGREKGGARAEELGVCRAAMEVRMNGVHGGKLGGRACWIVAGTLCGGKEQGTFAQKYHNCEQCDFYRTVKTEEGMKFRLSIVLLGMLQPPTSPAFPSNGARK